MPPRCDDYRCCHAGGRAVSLPRLRIAAPTGTLATHCTTGSGAVFIDADAAERSTAALHARFRDRPTGESGPDRPVARAEPPELTTRRAPAESCSAPGCHPEHS